MVLWRKNWHLFYVCGWKGKLANWYLIVTNICLRALACRQQNESDAKWLEGNLDAFSQYATYSDLKVFNLSAVSHTFHFQSSYIKSRAMIISGKNFSQRCFCHVKEKSGPCTCCLCPQVAVVHALSPQQKAELILDPQSGALADKAIVKEVFTSLTESAGIKQLSQFFQAFTVITKQVNA